MHICLQYNCWQLSKQHIATTKEEQHETLRIMKYFIKVKNPIELVKKNTYEILMTMLLERNYWKTDCTYEKLRIGILV